MESKVFAGIREDLGLTQAEMGMRLGGYSWRTVASWESGSRKIPAAIRIALVALDDKERLLEAIMGFLCRAPGYQAECKAAVEKVTGEPFTRYRGKYEQVCQETGVVLPNVKAYKAAYENRRQKRLKTAGKCVVCGEAKINATHCEKHRQQHAAHARNYAARKYAEKKANEATGQEGR